MCHVFPQVPLRLVTPCTNQSTQDASTSTHASAQVALEATYSTKFYHKLATVLLSSNVKFGKQKTLCSTIYLIIVYLETTGYYNLICTYKTKVQFMVVFGGKFEFKKSVFEAKFDPNRYKK